MTVIDKATRMTHIIPCNKTVTAAETARLYWRYVAKLHGIPRCIYTDRGTQFTSRLWRELWEIMGTQLRFSTAYHPQTQGVVERMNAVIGQMLRCTIHELNEVREWDSLLPTIELAINSLPNRSTGYSPFFLNYGFHPTVPAELIKGNEEIRQETIANFVGRMHRSWQVARKRLNQAVEQQAKWYDARHKPVSYREGDLVLLSTANLQVRGTPAKLKRKFAGPFRITECIGSQSYRLDLPTTWRVHNVFHVSLLKIWREDMYRRYPAPEPTRLEEEEDDQEVYEVEKYLRWRYRKIQNRKKREFLVLWKGYPIEEASWIPEDNITYKDQLQEELDEDNPQKVDDVE